MLKQGQKKTRSCNSTASNEQKDKEIKRHREQRTPQNKKPTQNNNQQNSHDGNVGTNGAQVKPSKECPAVILPFLVKRAVGFVEHQTHQEDEHGRHGLVERAREHRHRDHREFAQRQYPLPIPALFHVAVEQRADLQMRVVVVQQALSFVPPNDVHPEQRQPQRKQNNLRHRRRQYLKISKNRKKR